MFKLIFTRGEVNEQEKNGGFSIGKALVERGAENGLVEVEIVESGLRTGPVEKFHVIYVSPETEIIKN